MILGVRTKGASTRLVRELLELVVQMNERFYRRNPAAPPIDELGVKYRPDGIGVQIVIVAAEVIEASATVSCGTAAAAYAGYLRARGQPSSALPLVTREGEWHAVAETATAIWDPATALRRVA